MLVMLKYPLSSFYCFCASSARGVGLIPDGELEIPHAAQKKQNHHQCVNLLPYRAACPKPSSDLTRLKSQGQLCSVPQALRGSPVPHSFRLLVEFNCFQVPIPLMAVSWGPFPASGSCLDCLGHGPTPPS